MVTTLTYISILAGGILILLLLISLIGGLDLDIDIGGTDVDSDAGGLGVVKGFLTFISVSSWVVKILLTAEKGIEMAIGIGIFCGILAILLLRYLLKTLMRNEENVNWEMEDALFNEGTVYLRIPEGNESGIVNVQVNGVTRELKAKSSKKNHIKTGAAIRVIGVDGDFLIVEPN